MVYFHSEERHKVTQGENFIRRGEEIEESEWGEFKVIFVWIVGFWNLFVFKLRNFGEFLKAWEAKVNIH